MTALSSFGDSLTAQPSGVADCLVVQTQTYTVAGSRIAPGQPNMMIVYKNYVQDLMPITAENLCKLSMVPIRVECPHCRRAAVTEVEKVVGPRAVCMAFALGIAVCGGGPCILCCIWDGLKDRVHYCGSCKQFIAKKNVRLNANFIVLR